MITVIFTDDEGRKEAVTVDNNGMSTHPREEIDELQKRCVHKEFIHGTYDCSYVCIDGHQLEPLIVVYNYAWLYGGPEEGGWYYNSRVNPHVSNKHIDNGDKHRHQIAVESYDEWIIGENLTGERPHYC